MIKTLATGIQALPRKGGLQLPPSPEELLKEAFFDEVSVLDDVYLPVDTSKPSMSCSKERCSVGNGKTAILPSMLKADSIDIYGTLRCPDTTSSVVLEVGEINIQPGGAFVCGSIDSPFKGNLNITTYATSSKLQSIVVSGKGLLSLHGSPGASWTRLAASANGDQIKLQENPVVWKVSLVSASKVFTQCTGRR